MAIVDFDAAVRSLVLVAGESADLGLDWLKREHRRVVKEMLDGVTVTSISMDGASHSGVQSMSPEEAANLLLAAIERFDAADGDRGAPMMTHSNWCGKEIRT